MGVRSISKDTKKKEAKTFRDSGMSYEKIAKRLGVGSKPTIRKWLRDEG